MIMTSVVEKMSADELRHYLELCNSLDDSKNKLLYEQELLINSWKDLYLTLERVVDARKIRNMDAMRKEEYAKIMNDKYIRNATEEVDKNE